MRTLSIFLLLAVLRADAATPSAAEIVRKHLDAIGGARWQKVDSMLVTGSGPYGSVVWAWKKPNLVRTEEREEQYSRGKTLITAFDGKSGWTSNPFRGSAAPRFMTAEELRTWRTGLAIRSDLLDLPSDAKIDLIGSEKVEGRPAWKLSLQRPGNDRVYLWIDAQSYLLVQRARTLYAPWGGLETPVVPLHDYRNVEGLMIPHAIGSTMLTVEVNPSLDDATFRPPQPIR